MTKKSALDRLTPRERRFVEEYVIDFNGRQAAIRAGYHKASASSVASKNTSRPDMQAAIRELLEEPRNQQALAHLKAVAFSNIKDYLQIDGNNVTVIALSQLSPEKSRRSQEVRDKKIHRQDGTSRYRLQDRTARQTRGASQTWQNSWTVPRIKSQPTSITNRSLG